MDATTRWRVLARQAMLVAALFIAGCGGGGGGGGGGVALNSTPSISNMQFTPASVLQYDGTNGRTTVLGSFDFQDPGGDLAMVYLSGSDGSAVAAPVEGVAGHQAGTIQAMLEIDTTQIGQFGFQLYVTDAEGRRSNTLSGVFEVKPNDTASHWTQRSFGVPAGSPLWQKRVRWGAGQFVSVGAAVFTSPDGETWTQRSVPSASVLHDVAWSGSQWVAVGENATLLSSPDGVSWSTQTAPVPSTAMLNGVAWSGSQWVAVGTQDVAGTPAALILHSPDGVTWTEAPGTLSVAPNAVVWSGSQFVAVGSSLGLPTAQPVALTSPDGMNWTVRNIAGTTLTVLYDLAWSGTRYVAVGYGGAVTSTDGVNWTATGVGAITANQTIGWSGQRFLTCGTVYCQSATDTLQWQSTTSPPGTGTSVYGLAWNGNRWVAVGTNAYVATSP